MTAHTGKTCPYCQYPIKPAASVKVCPSCGIAHHNECWQQSGGCTTFGCTGQRSVRYSSPTRSTAPEVLDLSNIMSEPEIVAQSSAVGSSRSRSGEPALVSASRNVFGCVGIIGMILGLIIGAVNGGLLGAAIGAVLGAIIGPLLFFLLIGGAIGGMIGSVAGSTGTTVGAVVGAVVVFVLFVIAFRECSQ